MTRDLTAAKEWFRSQARGSERFGVVASSSAQRLKPHAIDVRVDVNPIHWFLNDASDTRSSFYMEDAATEFQVQGLELDWACVTWDADLRFTGDRWNYHSFRGSRWQNVHKPSADRFSRLSPARARTPRTKRHRRRSSGPGTVRGSPGLLRSGRLITHRVFQRFDVNQANALAASLGKTLRPAPDYSLTEVFADEESEVVQRPRLGFAA